MALLLMWPRLYVQQLVLTLHWAASVVRHVFSPPLVSCSRLQSLVISGLQEGESQSCKISYGLDSRTSRVLTFVTFCWSKPVTRPTPIQGVERQPLPFDGRHGKTILQRSMWTQKGAIHQGSITTMLVIVVNMLKMLKIQQLAFPRGQHSACWTILSCRQLP